jgi:GTPase Era involved in 16S rRNA processing
MSNDDLSDAKAENINFWDYVEDEEPPVENEVAREVQHEIRDANKYKFEHSEVRNIICVGRTRSGKTTATRVLQDLCYQPEKMDIFSQTVQPEFHTFAIKDEMHNNRYTFNIIDTPGLHEVKKVNEIARDDSVIIDTINFCLKNEVTKINSLLIFTSFESGLNQDDLDSIQCFMDKFSHERITVCLCITRFESKNPSEKNALYDQLLQHEFFAKLLKLDYFHVVYLGAVDTRSTTYTSVDSLTKAYKKIYEMRKSLLDILFLSKPQVKLSELPFSTHAKKDLLRRFREQNEHLSTIQNCANFHSEAFREALYKFELNLRIISQSELIVGDGIRKVYLDMQERMKVIAERTSPKMDIDLKKRFYGPLYYLDVELN